MDKDGGGRDDDGHDGGDVGGQHGSELDDDGRDDDRGGGGGHRGTQKIACGARGTGRAQQLSGAEGPTRGRLAGQRSRWQVRQARIPPADSHCSVWLVMFVARGPSPRRRVLTMKMMSTSPCLLAGTPAGIRERRRRRRLRRRRGHRAERDRGGRRAGRRTSGHLAIQAWTRDRLNVGALHPDEGVSG